MQNQEEGVKVKFKWFLSGFVLLFLCGFLVVFLCNNYVATAEDAKEEPKAENPIKVILDGEELVFDVPPRIINDRTMVPMRVIFEALGADVDWDNKTKTVTAVKDDLIVKTTIGEKTMYVNGVKKEMDIAPFIVDGRTLVPIRFVSEAFGCDVDWDGKARIVHIKSNSFIDPDYDDGYENDPDNYYDGLDNSHISDDLENYEDYEGQEGFKTFGE